MAKISPISGKEEYFAISAFSSNVLKNSNSARHDMIGETMFQIKIPLITVHENGFSLL